jgi:hypothetical protein
VQPAPNARTSDRPSLSSQNQESGLKSILSVGLGGQNPPASRPDCTGVPSDQKFQSGRIPILREPPQKLSVGDMVSDRDADGEKTK